MKKKERSLLAEEIKSKLSYTQDFLLTFLDGMVTEMHPLKRRGLMHATMPLDDFLAMKVEYRERAAKSRLAQLRYQKLATIDKQGKRMMMHLTDKGLARALRLKIETATKTLPDNYLCIVVFDIPERLRRVRSALRSLLKRIGFSRMQQSVWIGKLDIVEFFDALIEHMGAKNHIHVFVACKKEKTRFNFWSGRTKT